MLSAHTSIAARSLSCIRVCHKMGTPPKHSGIQRAPQELRTLTKQAKEAWAKRNSESPPSRRQPRPCFRLGRSIFIDAAGNDLVSKHSRACKASICEDVLREWWGGKQNVPIPSCSSDHYFSQLFRRIPLAFELAHTRLESWKTSKTSASAAKAAQAEPHAAPMSAV